MATCLVVSDAFEKLDGGSSNGYVRVEKPQRDVEEPGVGLGSIGEELSDLVSSDNVGGEESIYAC